MVETILCYWLLATKSLKDESMKVYDKLAAGDLPGSRQAVSMIVGRDTAALDEKGVTKAAVETVAENTSDGIIAPMLFMAVGGPVFGWFYKSINTMDSMVGYKNDKYLYFGRFAAKLDDVVNFLPARLSGVLMVLASGLSGFDGQTPGRSSDVTERIMPAPTLPRRKPLWQVRCGSSWQVMPGILESFIRNRPSEMI